MAKNSVIKQQGFKQKSSLKHVKTRTPYKAVDTYEKEFKYAYARDLGNMMDEYVKYMASSFGIGNIKLTKGEADIINVFESETDCGVEGDCGQAHSEI